MDIDASDEATGLPPLRQGPAGARLEEDEMAEAAFVPIRGTTGGTGDIQLPGHDEAVTVRYLHLRGLVHRPEAPDDERWIQTTLAIPVELVDPIMANLKVPPARRPDGQ